MIMVAAFSWINISHSIAVIYTHNSIAIFNHDHQSIDLHRSSNKRSLYSERQFLRLQPLSLLLVMSCSFPLSISASSCCIQQLSTPTYLSAKAVQWQLHSARAHVPILIQRYSGRSGVVFVSWVLIILVMVPYCLSIAGCLLVLSAVVVVWYTCLQPQPAAATAIVCAVITWGQTQISIRNYKLYCMYLQLHPPPPPLCAKSSSWSSRPATAPPLSRSLALVMIGYFSNLVYMDSNFIIYL